MRVIRNRVEFWDCTAFAEGSITASVSQPTANSTKGLLFVCFQRDLAKGFVAAQNRLNGEALEDYIEPIGVMTLQSPGDM
jgi:deferrochelatase/peroxidase EfeB